MRVPGHFLLTTFAILLLAAPQVSSGQMAQLTLEELSRSSTGIVVGEAQQKRSFWNDSRSQILTEITVRVDESLKGGAESEIVITVPGGRVGNTLYEVSDMPAFFEGEEVLLFVWQHPSGRALINGGAQGKLDVVLDPVSGRKVLRGASFTASEPLAKAGFTLGTGEPTGDPPLESVLDTIRTYVGNE